MTEFDTKGFATTGTHKTEWWYNHKTGEVEEGPQSLGKDRHGPFDTPEEAARALEIAKQRAQDWEDEDAAEAAERDGGIDSGGWVKGG